MHQVLAPFPCASQLRARVWRYWCQWRWRISVWLQRSSGICATPERVPWVRATGEGSRRNGILPAPAGKTEDFGSTRLTLGAEPVMDLHPIDRGRQRTHEGAVCFNGALYCPSTPGVHFVLEPLARGASAEETAAHDARSTELARLHVRRDLERRRRLLSPGHVPGRSASGSLSAARDSVSLSHAHPEIFATPDHALRCCTQMKITVPPSFYTKTRRNYLYPSAAHRSIYGRRPAAECANATIKDPASNDIARSRAASWDSSR